jgi:hypothetical protein
MSNPTVREKLVELSNSVIGDAVEDVAQPHKRINFQELARRDEVAQHRCRPATSITAKSPMPSGMGRLA